MPLNLLYKTKIDQPSLPTMWTLNWILTLNHTTTRTHMRWTVNFDLHVTFDSLELILFVHTDLGRRLPIGDASYLKILSSPGIDQIPVKPLLRLSTTALPRDILKVPEAAIVPPACSFPFFRINVITSTSLWVPKTVSSCCCDGWRSTPWAPWPEWKTVNALYRKRRSIMNSIKKKNPRTINNVS